MKKKLLWILLVALLFIILLRIGVYILQEKWRDWYYEDWVLTTFKQDEDLNFIVYKNFKMANWKYVSNYENGQTRLIENYKDWKPEWEHLFYDEAGNLRLIQNYMDWKLDWELVHYDEKNNIRSIAIFKNWLLDWESVYYDENGEITQKTYYESGVEIKFDENWNKFEWERIQYYPNWEIAVVENYKGWKLEWERVHYHGSYKTTCIFSWGHLENCKDSIR